MKTQAKVQSKARAKAKPKAKAKARVSKAKPRSRVRGMSNITKEPNPQLLDERTVTLNGSERAHVIRMVEKVAPGARTRLEKQLLLKVR